MTDQVSRPLGLVSSAGLGRTAPERANPAIAQALERLKHVDREVWDDIEAALRGTTEDHHNPELDELDCTLLLDLLWLYRHAEPLLTDKAAEVVASRERMDDCLQVLRMVDDNNRVDAGERRKAWRGSFVVSEVRRVLGAP